MLSGDAIDILVHAEMLSSAIENTRAETVEITPESTASNSGVGSRNASVPTIPIADNWTERQERKALSRSSDRSRDIHANPEDRPRHLEGAKFDENKHVELTAEPGLVRIACTSRYQTLWASHKCTTKGTGTVRCRLNQWMKC